MEVKKPPMNNQYYRKIVSALRKGGTDDNLKLATKFHSLILMKSVQNSNKFDSREEMCSALMSKLFFETFDMYPKEKLASKMGENYAWPVNILPSEIFREGTCTAFLREGLFYKYIKVGDTLATRITSATPISYHLKVLHKYGSRRILEDLNIEVLLNRDQANLESELSTGEYCIVAVIDIKGERNVKNICVSMKENSLANTGINRKLGRISYEELPIYILNPPESNSYTSYANYLDSSLAFQNHLLLNILYSDFGVDIYKNYSFYPAFANLTCDDEYSAQALLQKSKSRDITKYLSKALTERQRTDFAKAFENIDLALSLDPKYIKTYEIRSLIHTDKDLNKASHNAYLDWCKMLELDEGNEFAKDNVSKYLFRVSNKYYRAKNFGKAAEAGQKALEFNKDNKEACALVEYLKKKHPESFLDSDEVTLIALKEGLVAQLKEMNTARGESGTTSKNIGYRVEMKN